MFGDSKDIVNVRSNTEDAKILVNGNEMGKGTAQFALVRGKDATITASKPGCSDRTVQTEKRVVGATWLNILFWPGFIVDVATGAMHKTDPTDYTVTPHCG
jgi:hypothetical protein